jgi:hypothetical protein
MRFAVSARKLVARAVFGPLLALATTEETAGSGEPRERGVLDLRLSEGVAGEEKGRLLGDYEAGF